jgi:thiamine biosynthesis lipoprotein
MFKFKIEVVEKSSVLSLREGQRPVKQSQKRDCFALRARNDNIFQWSQILIFNFAFLIFNLAFLCGCQNQRLYKDNRLMLGTFVEVVSPDPRSAGIAFAEIKRIEGLLSKYKPESEISRLNKTGYLKASIEAFYIIKKSKELYQASDGAFDITVAPLADLWGFSNKKYILPKKEDIQDALKLVGSDKIILNESNNVIKFKFPGMKVDLGAIAKGYAVDCAVEKLRQAGIKSCLINAGGQVYCLGDKFTKPWKIAVQNPRGKGIIDYLELINKAISTSGDYRQYFIVDGKKYAHILNPKTGHPADSGLAGVTVVADDGLTADALSTAIFVLGKDRGAIIVKKFPGARIEAIN